MRNVSAMVEGHLSDHEKLEGGYDGEKRSSLLTPEDIHTCCVRRGVESLRRDDGGVNLTPLSAHDWKTRTLSS